MRLLLIRHGQTPDNVLGILGTVHPGPGLTALGARQAAEIPDAMRGEAIDAIYASTLLRTQRTAGPLAIDRGLDVNVLRGIHEIEAGSLEGLRDRGSVHTYLEAAFAWGLGDLEPRIPGGPDGHEFFGRFDADIEFIAAQGNENVVVFSHGAAIRVWVAGRATNVPPQYAGEHELDNTGVVELQGSPGAWTLTTWAGNPVGGHELADDAAADPTGEPVA